MSAISLLVCSVIIVVVTVASIGVMTGHSTHIENLLDNIGAENDPIENSAFQGVEGVAAGLLPLGIIAAICMIGIAFVVLLR